MNVRVEGIQNALKYIEQNLTEEISVKTVAEKAYVSEFHGINPSGSREKAAKLRDFAPLRIHLTLEGGMIMEYRIVEKEALTIMGRKRSFNVDDSYRSIPDFLRSTGRMAAVNF